MNFTNYSNELMRWLAYLFQLIQSVRCVQRHVVRLSWKFFSASHESGAFVDSAFQKSLRFVDQLNHAPVRAIQVTRDNPPSRLFGDNNRFCSLRHSVAKRGTQMGEKIIPNKRISEPLPNCRSYLRNGDTPRWLVSFVCVIRETWPLKL